MHLPQFDEEDVVLFCQARGKLKKQKKTILTGDRVELDELNLPERTAVIVQHMERKTLIDRPPLANIDQVIIVQAVRQPDFSPLWMDRYLVHFQLAVPFTRPILCLNKCDLEDDSGLLRLRSIYEPLGYFVIFASAHTGAGLEELARVMLGKVSVVSGPSGVGKSSLLNRLSPGLDIKVGRMENSFGVGRHTTTYSELYKLDLDRFVQDRAGSENSSGEALEKLEIAQEKQFSWVADTPGFNVMEFATCDPRSLVEQFTEINELGQYCKYSNCLHIVESDCAVRAALGDYDEEEGANEEDVSDEDENEVFAGAETPSEIPQIDIALSRYMSYCLMMNEAQEVQQAARLTSTKKEANFKSVGGPTQAAAKIIPKLSGKHRAAARNTDKQKVQREDFYDDFDAESD